MLNDRRHVLTQDAEKNVEEWDIILVLIIFYFYFIFIYKLCKLNI